MSAAHITQHIWNNQHKADSNELPILVLVLPQTAAPCGTNTHAASTAQGRWCFAYVTSRDARAASVHMLLQWGWLSPTALGLGQLTCMGPRIYL